MMTRHGWLKRAAKSLSPYLFAKTHHPTLGAMGEAFQRSETWPVIRVTGRGVQPVFQQQWQAPAGWFQPGQVVTNVSGLRGAATASRPYIPAQPLVDESFEIVQPPTGITYGQL